MAITSLKGRLGWLMQSNRLAFSSRDGARSPDAINYYPINGRVLTHKATSLNIAPDIDQRQLDAEIGGSLYPVGAFRAGYTVGGDFSIQPRLEDFMGWMLYALTGNILGEHSSADGVKESAFYMPFGDNAGKLPWMTIFKYVPGLGEASDALEIYEDVRVITGAFSVPAAGLLTFDATARGRTYGLTGDEHHVDRSSSLVTLWGTATGGAAATLTDSTQAWTPDEHIGAAALVRHASGDMEYAVITDNDATSLTVAGWEAIPVAGDRYAIVGRIIDSGVATGGTAVTLIDTAKAWIDDQFNAVAATHTIYVEDTLGEVAVEVDVITDTTTPDTITVAAFTHTPVAGDKYWIRHVGAGTLDTAIVGNIRRVEVNHGTYTVVAVNDWIWVQDKGTRRIEMKKALTDDDGVVHYYLYIDGEFFEEVEAGDIFIVIDQMNLDVGGTVTQVVDAELFTTDDEYNDWYIMVYDADGVGEGPLKVTDVVGGIVNTADLDGTLSQSADGFAFAVFMPDIDITWLPYECPYSIPISAEPESYFKGLAEPFGGDKLPVRQVTVTVDYTALGSDQEKLIGAYEDDDITIQAAGITLRFTYRIKNQDLWSNIATNRDISALINSFSSRVFESDVLIRTVSAARISNTAHQYALEWFLPHVTWTPGGAPRLAGNDVIEIDITGNVQEPCKVKNPIGPQLTITEDSNVLSGSIEGANFSVPVLAAQRGVDPGAIEEWALGKLVRVAAGTGEGQVRMVERYFPNDGTNPVGGAALATLTVTAYDPATNTITVSQDLSDDQHNGRVAYVADKGTVVVQDTLGATEDLVCQGRWDENPAIGDSVLIHTDTARIIPHRAWVTQLTTGSSELVFEDYFAVMLLTNSRDRDYADDIPETP